MTDEERQKREDAASFFGFGLFLLATVIAIAFGLVWSLLFGALCCLVIAVIKALP